MRYNVYSFGFTDVAWSAKASGPFSNPSMGTLAKVELDAEKHHANRDLDLRWFKPGDVRVTCVRPPKGPLAVRRLSASCLPLDFTQSQRKGTRSGPALCQSSPPLSA